MPEQTVGVDSPDSTRTGLSAGVGLMFSEDAGLDLAYQYIHFSGSQTPTNDTPLSFAGAAHLVGVSLRYVL